MDFEYLLGKSKGQSAIEYLTTYGWMLLVIAIVGGAIFTTVQNSSQVESTSGLANADVQIENFGVTNNGLETELRAASADQVENVNISLIDQDTGETVYSDERPTIPVGDTETVTFSDAGSSENTNSYGVEINYDTGGLEGLTAEGTITGRISINGTTTEGDGGNTDTNSAPTAEFTANTTNLETGETFQVNASDSSDSDGNIDAYEWDWTNDGTYEDTTEVQTHSYTSSGTYTVELRVTDDDGATNTTTKEMEATSIEPTSAVSRWTFDNADTSGSTAADSWMSNNGNINGATTGASGANQTYSTAEAYSFDGSNDYVSFPSLGIFDGSQSFSLAAWFQRQGTGDQIIISTGGERTWRFRYDSGNNALDFRTYDGSSHYVYSGTSISSGTWHHGVAVYDSINGMELYLNGSSEGSDSWTGTPNTKSGSNTIGIQGDDISSKPFDGSIDDVRIYNKPLNATEVSNLYNTGSIN